MIKISIFGAGYVGLVTGACFAEKNFDTYVYDSDEKKINNLKLGNNYIYEDDLDRKILSSKKKKKLFFISSLKDAIKLTDISFICVGTPLKKKARIDLRQIIDITKKIGQELKLMKKFHVIVYKSTLPPETINKLCIPILIKNSGKKIDKDFGVICNPEFLREGNAVRDFEYPDRVIIGFRDFKSKNFIKEIYSNFCKISKILFFDIKTAETIKYFSNSFFSLLISYSNEVANLCSKIKIDYVNVLQGLSLDKRFYQIHKNTNPEIINYMFPGIGYGGSCFPKDVKGFINFAKSKKSRLKVLEQVEKVNNAQPLLISKKIIGIFGKNFSKKKILFLGITFKENTNDLRNSTPAILYNEICKKNLNVDLYDPLIKTNIIDVNNKIKNKFKNIINKVNYKKKYDLVIINNKDRVYKNIAKKYNKKFRAFIFDSRRFLKNHNLKNYEGVGL
jgi:nucleotide sugar dehydrogenase